MASKKELEEKAFDATREQGVSNVIFRHTIARKLGLNSSDWECLSFLGIAGVSTPTDIARYTGLTSGSTTAMLDRLEKAGFIRRKPNPEDRRGVLIEITGAWTQSAGGMVAGIQKAQRELIASYTEEELETIIDFLTRFANNVKEQTRRIEEDF